MNNRREIKFRVWDTKLNIYVNFNTLPVIDFNSKEYIFQQFTGLKDIKDKEIYEGDILSINISSNYKNYLIKYLNCGFKLLELNDFGVYDEEVWLSLGFIKDNYNFHIIGNIFQNSELLK